MLLSTKAVDSLKHLKVKPTDDAPKFDPKKALARVAAIWNGSDLDENLVARNTRPTDRFAIILDPHLDRHSGYRFQVHPARYQTRTEFAKGRWSPV